MDLIPITQDNVATACRIQHQLFPGKDINADRDFVNGFLQPERGKEYWLLQVEEYNCPTDKGAAMVPMCVMSKSLYPHRECPKWGDRDIGLWRQLTKQVERLYE